MDRSEYRLIDTPHTLLQSFPLGSSGDTVTVSIYDVDDATQDVSGAAMTNVSGGTFKYSWQPNQANNFIIDFHNSTLDVHEYLYVKVVGTLTGIPGGSGNGSTLANLRTRFLKRLDRFNANDLTGTNSNGEIADLCLNDALSLIYSKIKDSRYTKAYPSNSLASVAGQSYIELSGITDLDEVVSMQDTTNNITLKEIPYWMYKTQVPDPSESTGTPYRYARLFNRIYLDPQPTAVITYQTDYVKNFARLTNDADQALLPARFDDWIYKEAMVNWFLMERDGEVPVAVLNERNDARETYIGEILSQFDMISESGSHWNDGDTGFGRNYDSPIGS